MALQTLHGAGCPAGGIPPPSGPVVSADSATLSRINMGTTVFINERNHAQQVAEQSEQRYRRLLASVTDYVYSVAVDRGRPAATSHGPGCEAVTGYTSREFEADPVLWYRMIYSEDRPAVTTQAERILRGETPPPLEHRIFHKNGRVRWIRNTPVPRKDDQGRLISYDGLISDITDRKRAEQFLAVQYAVTHELAEASSLDEALARILENLCTTFQCYLWDMAAFWGVDAKANLLRCGQTWNSASPEVEEFSAAGRRFTLAPGISLPGQVWATGQPAWIPDMLKVETNCPRAPYARKAGLHGACAFPIRSGKAIVGVIELFSRHIQPPDPDMPQVLVAVGTQIGQFIERKAVEEQHRLSEAQLQAILDNSPAVIHLKDTQGRYLLTNRRFQQLFHLTREEIIGKSQHDLFPQETASVLRNHDQKVLATLTPMEFEETLPQDGELHTYISVKFPLLDAAGVPYAVCGISTDITERKRAEERLEQAYAELSQNEAALKTALQKLRTTNEDLQKTQLQLIQAAKLESVGTLAAGVAHEVKNPLQTILLGLDYLANDLLGMDGTTKLVLSDMRDAVTRANVIVRELLQLSAATDFESKEEDLNGLVERSLWLLHNEIVASQIKVVRKLGADLPRVLLDPIKMEQVFINLFINALQAMSQGGTLTVTTRHRRFGKDLKLNGPAFAQFKPGERVVIAEVQDIGKGIPEDQLPRIFEPFFTTKPTGVGTGLGLSVAKKIMDLHGGAIDIRNAPLGGVIATLVLKAGPEAKQ